MPLSKKGLEQIRRLGFNNDYFVVNKDGWLQLKNYNGKCVFNDGEQCSIYENRPGRCNLYPIVYDDAENYATSDEDCPHRDEFKASKTDIATLISLISKLEDGRKKN